MVTLKSFEDLNNPEIRNKIDKGRVNPEDYNKIGADLPIDFDKKYEGYEGTEIGEPILPDNSERQDRIYESRGQAWYFEKAKNQEGGIIRIKKERNKYKKKAEKMFKEATEEIIKIDKLEEEKEEEQKKIDMAKKTEQPKTELKKDKVLFSFKIAEDGPVKEFKPGEIFEVKEVITEKGGQQNLVNVQYEIKGSGSIKKGEIPVVECVNKKNGEKQTFTERRLRELWDKNSIFFNNPDPKFSDSVQEWRSKHNIGRKIKTETETTKTTKKLSDQNKIVFKNTEILDDKDTKDKQTLPEKKEILKISDIIKILKNEKVDEIVVSGTERNMTEKELKFIKKNFRKLPDESEEENKKKLEKIESEKKILTSGQDLDSQMALYLFNYLNNRTDKKGGLKNIYGENAKSTIINTNQQEKIPLNENKGIRLFIDAGVEWIKIEKEGKTTTIWLDHHGEGKRSPTSGTKMMYDLMKEAGILKESKENVEWVEKFVNFVNEYDNLTYVNNKDFDQKYFENIWPNSLYAIAEMIPFELLMGLIKSGKIKNPSIPFAKKELLGEFGTKKLSDLYEELVKSGHIEGPAPLFDKEGKDISGKNVFLENKKRKLGDLTILKLCQKRHTKPGDGAISIIKNIKIAEDYNKKFAGEKKLNFDNTLLGKVLYHNDYGTRLNAKGEEKNIYIDNKTAFIGIKAMGYDTYVNWDGKNKNFYINSNHPKLSEIVKNLNEEDPDCALDVRGVFVFGKIKNLSETKFLEIIQGESGAKKPEIKTAEPVVVDTNEGNKKPTKNKDKKDIAKKETEEEKTKRIEEEKVKQEKIKENEAKIEGIEKEISMLMRKMPHQKIEGVQFSELNFDDLDFYEQRFKAEQKRSEPFSEKVSDFWKNKLVELGKIKNLLAEREGLKTTPEKIEEKPKAAKEEKDEVKTPEKPKTPVTPKKTKAESAKKTLPADILNKTEPKKENKKTKESDVDTFDRDKLETEVEKVIKMFAEDLKKKNIKYENLNITTNERGFHLVAHMSGIGFGTSFLIGKPNFVADIECKDGKIIVLNHRLEANHFVNSFVNQEQINKLANTLGEEVKKYIEEKENKKIERFDIEDGALKITYK